MGFYRGLAGECTVEIKQLSLIRTVKVVLIPVGFGGRRFYATCPSSCLVERTKGQQNKACDPRFPL